MKTEEKPYAFTGHFSMFRNRIVSDILLCSPEEGNPNSVRVRALWDTGCSKTLVSRRVADFLNLPAGGTMLFRSALGVSKSCELNQAKVCVVLGGARVNLEVGVNEHPNSDPDCDVTLGLDFITQGDFAISHDDEQLVLSFCYPPLNAPILYDRWSREFRNDSVVESIEVNEMDAVESRRRQLIMLDNMKECKSKESNSE